MESHERSFPALTSPANGDLYLNQIASQARPCAPQQALFLGSLDLEHHAHQVRERVRFHLLHHARAMDLDGAL